MNGQKSLILKQLKLMQSLKDSENFWNITWDQGIFISNLILIKKPQNILEIGTSNGFSTLFLAKNLDYDTNSIKNHKIDTIEVNKERFEISKQNFCKCNISDIINSHLGNVYDIIPKLNCKYDLVFIDAEQENYFNLLGNIEKYDLLNKEACIIFDNILNHDSTKNFIVKINDYITETKKYHLEIIDLGSGFLYLRRL